MAIRNPAAVKVLIGWVVVAVITLGCLSVLGFGPSDPGFYKLFLPAALCVFVQGLTAMMAVRRGYVQMAWLILLVPLGLSLLFVVGFLLLLVIGLSS